MTEDFSSMSRADRETFLKRESARLHLPEPGPEAIARFHQLLDSFDGDPRMQEAVLRTMMGPASYDFSETTAIVFTKEKPKGRSKVAKNIPPSLRSRIDKIVGND